MDNVREVLRGSMFDDDQYVSIRFFGDAAQEWPAQRILHGVRMKGSIRAVVEVPNAGLSKVRLGFYHVHYADSIRYLAAGVDTMIEQGRTDRLVDCYAKLGHCPDVRKEIFRGWTPDTLPKEAPAPKQPEQQQLTYWASDSAVKQVCAAVENRADELCGNLEATRKAVAQRLTDLERASCEVVNRIDWISGRIDAIPPTVAGAIEAVEAVRTELVQHRRDITTIKRGMENFTRALQDNCQMLQRMAERITEVNTAARVAAHAAREAQASVNEVYGSASKQEVAK